MITTNTENLGVSGRIARYFQSAQITPLIALVALLLGMFAVLVTPREEEPQINVTMANVLIPFPGASAKNVEQMVSIPAEQVLSQIADVEHVTSVSRPGIAVITVQFQVGVPRTEALVRLYNTIQSNQDWLPKNLGVGDPIIKPKGIDDVPILAATLYAKNNQDGAYELERVAHALEAEIKHVKGTREVVTLGGPGRAVNIDIDPVRMAASNITIADMRSALQSANLGAPLGEVTNANQSIAVEVGRYFADAKDIAELVVGIHNGHPVYLGEVAKINDGPPPAERYVWYGEANKKLTNSIAEYPAVTISVTKKPGQNAVAVADAVIKQIDRLKNVLIPAGIEVKITRNYGETANDKAQKLIQKLIFATSAVIALVFLALGRREAAIVGVAVILTLTATLFASWAWGFTLNRVSLFALIFSIGILVDDAIVVVENIHRHMKLKPSATLTEIIPVAVDEVGGPTILATLAVIAALLPMAFVTGLMGPYMSPIPINASMGMLISLAVAFIITPWLSRIWLRHAHHEDALTRKIAPVFTRMFNPFLSDASGKKNRRKLWLVVLGLIILSLALPVTKLVVLKMLPFDNKSEFQVVVDMPAGTPPETTASVLHAMTAYLATVPEVTNYQAYVGLSAPINFNGLVRQYYLRGGGEVGDIQVNLVDKHHRSEQSHAIAGRVRPELQKIAQAMGAKVKVVEVPPGPPVISPIVAEIYGPIDADRLKLARQVQQVFDSTDGIVDTDNSGIADAKKIELVVDKKKAALLGVSQAAIVSTLRTGLAGEDVTYLHDATKYPAGTRLRLPVSAQGDIEDLLKLSVSTSSGKLVPIRELVSIENTLREQPIFHKDLLPVNYVVADMAGKLDSPLYGMFDMRDAVSKIQVPSGGKLGESFISQPEDNQRGYALKWDGEWQVTYETFRDMGAAYAVGLILIYLLVVAQFGSYLTPLIIMAPIPLTIIGVMPGHALLGAQYTATSMIGMIALAGIIVRNSILLVDFINLEVASGKPFKEAVINSAITRAQPIVLTALSAMLGAFFILDDPIFNGLAISLIFGIFVSTLLTLIVIPLLYFVAYKHKFN
ncbi:MAG: efflux RND transporter permease subunit [Methylotenera sp.]|nr:efflux RND transporter permease subunit [Methylotenera sp.]MDO9388323.1 efflux RND transporter permease subunit [Methylotenera sp.]MDP2101661.1 efflux RND transporter permease subunit [Methylotenera sp.]MDP2280859.1 efflux RND transporter permease subunit [Methylotenera sp.]MDP3060918.1 efflux RND transporter permease subunit [Methylotenera sp.]